MAKQELSEMQEKFCQMYVETGKGRESAIAAGYAEGSSSVQASRMMTTTKIKNRIAQIRKNLGIDMTADKDQVVEALLKMISDEDTEPNHKLTAIDKLSRIQGWFKESTTIDIHHNNIDKISDDELDKKMRELEAEIAVERHMSTLN